MQGVTVLGDTVNFAARCKPPPSRIRFYMSEATHRLMQGLVEASSVRTLHQRKNPTAKGLRLDGIRQGVSRFDAAVSRGSAACWARHELEYWRGAHRGTLRTPCH